MRQSKCLVLVRQKMGMNRIRTVFLYIVTRVPSNKVDSALDASSSYCSVVPTASFTATKET